MGQWRETFILGYHHLKLRNHWHWSLIISRTSQLTLVARVVKLVRSSKFRIHFSGVFKGTTIVRFAKSLEIVLADRCHADNGGGIVKMWRRQWGGIVNLWRRQWGGIVKLSNLQHFVTVNETAADGHNN